MQRKAACLWGVCLALALAAPGVMADDIKVDQLWYQGARITGLRDGRVIYNVRGINNQVPLAKVRGLRFGNHPQWEQAEKAIEAGEGAKAVELLQTMLGELGRREVYLRPLVVRKLVEAYDAAGLFNDAVNNFVELAKQETDPYFFAVVPSQLPRDAGNRNAAVTTITRALADANAAARPALEKLLAQLKQAPAEPAPPTNGAAGTPAAAVEQAPADAGRDQAARNTASGPADLSAGDDRMVRIQRDLAESKFDEVLQSIAFMKTHSRNPPLAELYFAQGLAYAGKNQPLDAAIAFLRVAVHFPEHEQAVNALIQAGRMLKAAGKDEQAANVWREAMGRTEDAAVRRQIQQLLSSLN